MAETTNVMGPNGRMVTRFGSHAAVMRTNGEYTVTIEPVPADILGSALPQMCLCIWRSTGAADDPVWVNSINQMGNLLTPAGHPTPDLIAEAGDAALMFHGMPHKSQIAKLVDIVADTFPDLIRHGLVPMDARKTKDTGTWALQTLDADKRVISEVLR